MAEIRNPVSTPAVPLGRPIPPQRVQAAREAQRAFFNAALAGGAEPTSSGVARVPVQAAVATAPLSAPDPRLRPGSIVDIKV